jgi:hypothetical protein
MKLKLFICLVLFSVPALAADDSSHWYSFISDFFDWIKDIIADFTATFFDGIAAFVHRAMAYFIIFAVTIKLYLFINTLEFAYSIAQEISKTLNLFGYLSSALSSLPSDLKYMMNLWGVPNCLNIIMNAYITRFVMNFMGW